MLGQVNRASHGSSWLMMIKNGDDKLKNDRDEIYQQALILMADSCDNSDE